MRRAFRCLIFLAFVLALPMRADTLCLPSMPTCPGVACGVLLSLDCELPNGCTGIRRCLAGGTGYGACECRGVPGGLGPACVNSCSGLSGRKVCNAACVPQAACVVGPETRNCCDDDGDALIDEGLTSSCTTPCGGPGTWLCTANGPRCVGTETCNNCDDDSDGRIDNVKNTTTPLSRACGDSSGFCNGVQTCTAGQWSVCACPTATNCASVPACAGIGCYQSATPQNACHTPPRGALCTAACTIISYCVPNEPRETCNGNDDDCNGETDEHEVCNQKSECCPATCAEAGVTCGSIPTSCGTTLDCGDSCP